jgi:Condensation domain
MVKIVRSIKRTFGDILKQANFWPHSLQSPQGTSDVKLEEEKRLLTQLMLTKTVDGSGSDKFEASLSQQSLWLIDQFYPDNSAYNLQIGLRFAGVLDQNALEYSLQEIVNRHDILRTKFKLDGTRLFQFVVPKYKVSINFRDMMLLPETGRYQEAYQIALQETQASFDLAEIPLFRFTLIRLASDCHVLNCAMSHIICDGWSLGLFVKELTTLYHAFLRAQTSPLKPLPIQYGDYAQWQREATGPGLIENQIDYWRNKLIGAPPLLSLSASRSRPSSQTFVGSSQTLPLSEDLIRGLKRLAAKHDGTLFMVALAAFQYLLFRYSNQRDILIGIPVARRDRAETEEIIGLFVNTVVMRADLSQNPRFCDLLDQVRATALEAFCNSDLPFAKLVEELRPTRHQSYNPIFQVMFAVIKAAVEPDMWESLRVTPYIVSHDVSRFDLTMNLIEGAHAQWLVQLEYNTNLYDQETMIGFLSDYVSTLQAIEVEPDVPIWTLHMMAAREHL